MCTRVPLRPTLAAVLAACVLIAMPALAQDYPEGRKTIKIVVPTSPGGGNDVMARIIAQKLGERLNSPVIVENKAGANGAIATEAVARSPADGYTILFGYIATHGINPGLSKVPYDPVNDFAPITEVAEAQGVLVVNPSLSAKSVEELIALAKASPGKLAYASAGNGTAPHISGELFKQLAGVNLLHVPYKGAGPAMVDTIGGQTQIMFPSLIASAPHVKAGTLRALAVTGSKRSPLYPSLPTMAESGLPGFAITQWYGLFAPAKTPKPIVDKLNREITAVMKDPDTTRRFAEQGADVVVSSPEEFGKFVQAELTRWKAFIKSANITAE